MKNEKGILLSATFACLLLTGKPTAAGSGPSVPSPVLAVELSSPAGGEFLPRLLASDFGGGPSSFSIPGSDAFLSWVTGGGAVVWAAPGGPDAPPTVLQGTGCHDFVTGGGKIPVGTSLANFGFVAGLVGNGTVLFVALNYIDHNTGMHVKATSITVYNPGATADCRHFEGDATIDGVGGFTYSVDVCDNGEPGTGTDTFAISLSTGYSASGTLEGGNIQLHDNCP